VALEYAANVKFYLFENTINVICFAPEVLA